MNKRYLAGLILALAFNTVYAQESRRLNEGWEYLRQDLGGIWEAVRPVVKINPEGVPLWDSVSLPHCFNAKDAVDPDVNYYQGPGWYRSNLTIENPYKAGRTILHFEGAGQKTDVYVYMTKVASHTGGYDEWSADITDAVEAFKKTKVYADQFKGKVPVSIRCDNSRDLEIIPSDLSDFNIYGGLYRYLNLVYKPSLSVSSLKIEPLLSGDMKSARLRVSATLEDFEKTATASVGIRVSDPKGKIIQQSEASLNVSQGIQLLKEFSISRPMLWSPANPQLYKVEVTVNSTAGKNEFTENIGFRSFSFQPKGPLLFNGQRLLLQGTHRHEDHAGVAAAMTEEMMREEMLLIKNMGVNFLRLGHYQQSKIILNLCDSLGIVVWEEIPWCRGGLGGDSYKEMARRMLRNIISQHYNHPSVIIWGLGNENDWPGDAPVFDKEKIRAFMAELNDISHAMDSTRKTAIRR